MQWKCASHNLIAVLYLPLFFPQIVNVVAMCDCCKHLLHTHFSTLDLKLECMHKYSYELSLVCDFLHPLFFRSFSSASCSRSFACCCCCLPKVNVKTSFHSVKTISEINFDLPAKSGGTRTTIATQTKEDTNCIHCDAMLIRCSRTTTSARTYYIHVCCYFYYLTMQTV